MAPRRIVAMGDPQAPFATVLAILARHGLLGADGRLRANVQLVSMGDHFDWGPPERRAEATADALALLRWLAAHPPEQVVLLAGNHDLARVGELAPFSSDEAFAAARAHADVVYRRGAVDEAGQQAFLARVPHVPDAEALARDFSCYSVEQQHLVAELLRAGRFRLAFAHAGLLLVHAGVTRDDLAALGVAPTTAEAAAAALNAFLEARVAAWAGGPLDLAPLHQPGAAATGVARGILFHRPAHPSGEPHAFAGPPRRRFDPRHLPAEFPQAIGHIRDAKCRTLLGPWCDAAEPHDGPVRSLRLDGPAPTYQRGAAPDARLYFLDGGMLHAPVEDYELFDLTARAPLQPTSKRATRGT